MAGKFFILRDVADFAPGFFESTAVEGGSIQLQAQGGAYPPAGSYTSPPLDAEPFFSLTPSWNASCPPGTAVEMQARVASNGRWSRWFSFGRWSPWQVNAAPVGEADDIARGEREALSLQDGCPAADMVQLRIFLYAENGAATPQVWLLAVSTNAAQQQGQEPHAYDRELELPAYSCQNRDPAISARIAGATCLCMLVNRWGCDLLPEEVARFAYDASGDSYGNLAYIAAAAGVAGFSCYVSYAGLAALRREVWEGRCVGARVHYRAPALPGVRDDEDLEGRPQAPVLDTAAISSTGHLVAVRGFARRGDKEVVLVHDPLGPSDDAVAAEIPLSVFARIYTGVALFMRRGPAGSGGACPRRQLAELTLEGGAVRLTSGGETLVPRDGPGGGPATLCYTLSDGVAYAQQAQKRFYYPRPGEAGEVYIDSAAAAGRLLTVYLFAGAGQSYVGERHIENSGKEGKS